MGKGKFLAGIKLNNYLTSLVLFVLLIPILYLIHILNLSPVLKFGFTPDDWGLLLFYETLGDDPLSKIPYVWSIKGAYTTSQVYFIGILNNFFGMDYQSYQITNIILKALATLSLYPLILIIFKRKSLAFLTTIVYGMSYMASRSLEYVVKGTDYLAIINMNIFLIIYYFIIQGKLTKLYWFALMSFFWFASLMSSPIRMYPILVLIPLIEIYLWIQNRSVSTAVASFKRLLILYFPFLLIYLYKPNSIQTFLQNPPTIYQAILNGNWHVILTPFQGVGLSAFFTEYWSKFFGVINLSSFRSYLDFLLGFPKGPLFIFGTFTFVLSVLKFKKKLRFFVITSTISLAFFTGFFLIANHTPSNSGLAFDPNRMYPILISGFMLAISWSSFLEWKDLGKKDNLLLALWISPPIILIYTCLIWLLAPFGVGFEGPQGYYLVVPSIATGIFLSSIIIIIYDKALKQTSNLYRLLIILTFFISLIFLYITNSYNTYRYYVVPILIVSLLISSIIIIVLDRVLKQRNSFYRLLIILTFFISLIFLYITNSYNTYRYYVSAGTDGRYAQDQDKMYNQVLRHLGTNFKTNEPILFYFDMSEDGQRGTFYAEGLFLNLASRLRIRNGGVSERCAGVFYQDIFSLAKLVVVKDDVKGFIYPAQCGGVFYKPNNFYAFKVKNGELIDIKQEVLERLGF